MSIGFIKFIELDKLIFNPRHLTMVIGKVSIINSSMSMEKATQNISFEAC